MSTQLLNNKVDPEISLLKTHDWSHLSDDTQIELLRAIEEYGKQMWNAALDWASENAETIHLGNNFVVVAQESILKGKI